MTFWLSLPVHSGSLKRIDYPKRICVAHALSFECFHCSLRNSFLYFICAILTTFGFILVFVLTASPKLEIIVCSLSFAFIANSIRVTEENCLSAHLSLRLTGELIVYPCSGAPASVVVVVVVVVVHHFQTSSPLKPLCQSIRAKFYVKPPWEGGTKVF